MSKSKLPSIPDEHKSSAYYKKFQRAIKEETLDSMYEASKDKLRSMEPPLRRLVLVEIEIAYSKRQDDFDNPATNSVISKRDSNLRENDSTYANSSPEDQLSKMLKEMASKDS